MLFDVVQFHALREFSVRTTGLSYRFAKSELEFYGVVGVEMRHASSIRTLPFQVS